MPAIALSDGISTGHACYPPVGSSGYTSTAFFNGRTIQLRNHTVYGVHCCPGPVCHGAGIIVEHGGPMFMEGKEVAMIGDGIACGDNVASYGSPNAFAI